MPIPPLPEQLVRTARFTHGVPAHLAITSDGRTVLFLRSRAGDDPLTCLGALDLDSGTERLLADPVTLRRQRSTGVGAYAMSRRGDLVAFVLAGELWAVRVTGGPPWRLPTPGPVSDPRPDPTGHRIAYVNGGALRLMSADGMADRAIAEPDAPDVEFGTAVHTAATAPNGPLGHWWSPGGTQLLIARTDSSRVRPWPALDSEAPGRRFAAVGTPNADVTLWIAGDNGLVAQARWDREGFEYVVGAGWDEHGPYVVVQSRDQRTVRLLSIDPGDGRTTVLHEQRDDRWVHLVPGIPVRTGSGALLAHADLHGTRRLTVDGVPVTPTGLQLRSVLGVDGDEVLFAASESAEPTEAHVYSYGRTAGVLRLSSGPAVHSGLCRAGTLVEVERGADRPDGRIRVRRSGRPTVTISSYAEQPVLDVHPLGLVLGPRELRARLHLPSWFRAGSGQLPVLADPYGGAAVQRVTAELDWRVLVSQWFAEHGFAVLGADGRGTPGRGPEWEREVHGDLFGAAVEDQVTAVREAGRLHPELDLGRVGVRGWSFGGSLAVAAVLRRPDVFHAAVAGAGVTDQRLYNAHWRERSLGHPDRFPERYEACSLVRDAPRLLRPLLLMHGLDDRNVPPLNTVRLSDALREAGRPHEVFLMPGVGHQPIGSPVTGRLMSRQIRFLQRHLGGQGVVPLSPRGAEG
ncbi:prolyl oligopeptidase family serine peptidase [Streptomyces sp. NPDC092369]|uniref:S9 family peptidase n=1 Tax=Streptomyces sp. NPDC092369 TaxID=3366015 RepID=UPI00382135F5